MHNDIFLFRASVSVLFFIFLIGGCVAPLRFRSFFIFLDLFGIKCCKIHLDFSFFLYFTGKRNQLFQMFLF